MATNHTDVLFVVENLVKVDTLPQALDLMRSMGHEYHTKNHGFLHNKEEEGGGMPHMNNKNVSKTFWKPHFFLLNTQVKLRDIVEFVLTITDFENSW